jgi:hypothetical protein
VGLLFEYLLAQDGAARGAGKPAREARATRGKGGSEASGRRAAAAPAKRARRAAA